MVIDMFSIKLTFLFGLATSVFSVGSSDLLRKVGQSATKWDYAHPAYVGFTKGFLRRVVGRSASCDNFDFPTDCGLDSMGGKINLQYVGLTSLDPVCCEADEDCNPNGGCMPKPCLEGGQCFDGDGHCCPDGSCCLPGSDGCCTDGTCCDVIVNGADCCNHDRLFLESGVI